MPETPGWARTKADSSSNRDFYDILPQVMDHATLTDNHRREAPA